MKILVLNIGSSEGSRAAVWVIPTDEERLSARDTWRGVTGADLPF